MVRESWFQHPSLGQGEKQEIGEEIHEGSSDLLESIEQHVIISSFNFLISAVMFIFSVFAASANYERIFSRMGYMISSRRARLTADNADKRLTICNQIPQKRRLLDLCEKRKIQKAKLFEI